jgi:hypothetical protein
LIVTISAESTHVSLAGAPGAGGRRLAQKAAVANETDTRDRSQPQEERALCRNDHRAMLPCLPRGRAHVPRMIWIILLVLLFAGPKPTGPYADGRLDAINYTWDLHGARAANTWTEAIYATLPASGRWEDLEERLPVLEEATGLSLELPPPAARLQRSRGDRERYAEGAELELEDVYGRAREAAVMQTGGDVDEEAPF